MKHIRGRRVVLKSLIFSPAALALGTIKLNNPNHVKVVFRFSGKSDEEVVAYLKMIDDSGVRKIVDQMVKNGHIIYKSVFPTLANGVCESTTYFKSQESFELFIKLNKPTVLKVNNFQDSKDVKLEVIVSKPGLV